MKKNNHKYIGVDLGTSSIKISLVNTNGVIINEASETYPIYVNGDWCEQNPNDWFNKFEICLDKVLKNQNKNEIKGLSFSGQMHGLVILDKNDKIIRPCILWNDSRAKKEVDYLNNIVSKKTLNKLTGNIAYAGFTAPKILWVKTNEPNNFRKISKIMLPKDFLAYKLTNNFATDFSDAAGTLYLDVKNKKWSKQMLKIIGINEKQLPKLYESYQFIGYINKKFKEKHKLGDVKVFIGAGDNAASAIAMGITKQNEINISLGTSGTIFIPMNKFKNINNNSLHVFNDALGKWCLLGCILSAASARKWWLENIINKSYFLDEIKMLKANTNGLYFLPYLSGERSPHNDTNIRGGFIGLRHTTSKYDMSKAILEGVSFAIRDCLEIAKKNKINFKKATICGGGANSNIWLKIIANVLNIPIYKTNGSGSYGAAIIAMIGNKEISFSEINTKLNKYESIIKPTKKIVNYYNNKYQTFIKLYPSLKNIKLN